ncbi:STAS domain-containing protein [Streptomyces sp. NRRL S-350]|uniref:STAS domain-containing protein n=1 Tax=Streptomyces sp. NRRL S-350 TaxID=1463902 RepID=UPI00068F1D8F|nr:STAS domain-containing protein [Streptomyces sp. NRRL S-350]
MTPSDNDHGEIALSASPPRAELAVRARTAASGAVVCVLVGDLDIETLAPAADALTTLLAQRPSAMVIDLEGVDFCDSSGLNLLLRTRLAAGEQGVALHLAAVSPTVMRVLELTGAQAVFSLHRSVEAALAAPAA